MEAFAAEDFCYLTTTGRLTGRPHEVEIWFSLDGQTLYMLAGNPHSDWVENLQKEPMVSVRIADKTYPGQARVVEDTKEDALARSLLVGKYEKFPGRLSEWRRTALPVAVDL